MSVSAGRVFRPRAWNPSIGRARLNQRGRDSLGPFVVDPGSPLTELDGTSGHSGSDGWLSPTGAAIAGSTIAVLSLLTIGAWALALQTFMDRNGTGAFTDVVMSNGVAQGLLAIGALVLAGRGLASNEITAHNLAGATVVLGVLGLVVASLTVVAGFVAAN